MSRVYRGDPDATKKAWKHRLPFRLIVGSGVNSEKIDKMAMS